jgi:hypothetical protein
MEWHERRHLPKKKKKKKTKALLACRGIRYTPIES